MNAKVLIIAIIPALFAPAAFAGLLSTDCPRFIFQTASGDVAVGGGQASLLPLPGGGTLEVETIVVSEDDPRAQYKWRAPIANNAPGVMLKWARYRLANATEAILLKEIILEDLTIDAASARVFPGAVQSYPVFAGNRFYGVEFPIARTRVENGRLLLAYFPGRLVTPGEWHETRRAVAGEARDGDALGAFHRYIAAHARFNKRHTNYNSWWTSPAPYYTEKDILDLMAVFEEKMFKPHGSMFDTFCIDMGWSNKDSIWEIDPELFPQGFTRLQAAAERMNCRLGLWISPSSRYPTAQDVDWARDNGYEAMKDGMCLGGPRYAGAFRERLVEMAQTFGIRHFKLDGYVFECPETNHGHQPSPLSADAVAEGVIAAADAVHAVAPDAWFEPTGFGYNPSPWWLLHFNSVIGCFGDDAPWGRVPTPDYREAYTTARDYYNLQSAAWSAVPPAGMEVLGVIHQTSDDFTNDAVVTILRGHQFLPFYVNPAHMNENRWARLAALNAQSQHGGAARVVAILPKTWREQDAPQFEHDKPMPREPYGYLSIAPDRTLALLRNPWVAPQDITFDLRPYIDLPPEQKAIKSVYPEPRAYAQALDNGCLNVKLAPYETVVLDLTASVEGIPPRENPNLIRTENASIEISRVQYTGPEGALGPDWTSLVGDAKSAIVLDLSADVTLESHGGELLVLHDGCKETDAGATRISVNGRHIEPEVTSSETGWSATGVKNRPDHWRFLRVPLETGRNEIRVKTESGGDGVLTSAWVRATRPGKPAAGGAPWPEPEVVSLDGAALLAPANLAESAAESVTIPRPVERIDGVFLDAVEPAEVSQGYGTLQKNRAILEGPLTINCQRFPRGLGTHAPSRIVYNLDGRYKKFQAWAGADYATAPTIELEVRVDGQTRWKSGVMKRDTPAAHIDIAIAGANSLELVVTDAGNGINADHADWANAKLLR